MMKELDLMDLFQFAVTVVCVIYSVVAIYFAVTWPAPTP